MMGWLCLAISLVVSLFGKDQAAWAYLLFAAIIFARDDIIKAINSAKEPTHD